MAESFAAQQHIYHYNYTQTAVYQHGDNGGGDVQHGVEHEACAAGEGGNEVFHAYGVVPVAQLLGVDIVTVEQGINPANRSGWALVTDPSTLAIDDQVIIVAMNADKALGCLASSSSATNVSNIPAVEVDKTGNVVYDAEKSGAMIFTLKEGNSEGTFAFQFTHKEVDYYLNAPSSGLKGRSASSGANDDTSYAITIDATNGDATIKNARPKVVKFNYATGVAFLAYSTTAANATKAENAICIYKKE